jgi:NitT/TauT family transport system ATP-binding protein
MPSNTTTEAALSVTDLSVRYRIRGGELTALDHVSLSIAPGEFVAIVGPSGCGKSTLLGAMAGLVRFDEGTVDMPAARSRQGLGFVFQKDALLPWETVLDNVIVPLKLVGVDKAEREERARAQLKQLGLEGFERYFPSQLSGGMRQRVSIARTLIYSPDVVFMDEPFGALDAQTKGIMQEMLLDLWQLSKPTIVFVTHDIAESIYLADRVLVMSRRPGRISKEIRVPVDRPRPSPFEMMRDPDYVAVHDEVWEAMRHDIVAN